MKNLIVLICLLLSLVSWNSYSQETCAPYLEGCNSDMPDIVYDVDENRSLAIVVQEVNPNLNGNRAKIYFREGSNQLELVTEDFTPKGIKIAVDKVLLNIAYTVVDPITGGSGYGRNVVKLLKKDPLGNFVESIIFEEIIASEFISYSYDELIFEDGFAYIKRTKNIDKNCSPTDDDCWLDPFIVEVNYFKASVETGEITEVNSIPSGRPTNQTSYTFFENDIYKFDPLTGTFKLWIRNYKEGGVHGFSTTVGEFLYYSYRTPDGSTYLIEVKLTDDIAQPKKILMANFLGAIVMLDYQPNEKQSALVFRETDDNFSDSTEGQYDVPGWDHVGLWIADEDKVFESMPLTPAGQYYDTFEDIVKKTNVHIFGVQSFHSLGTFTQLKYHEFDPDLSKTAPAKTIESLVVPIENDLAESMKNFIQSKLGSSFNKLINPPYLHSSYMPEYQKGLTGAYTCVGLMEAAAENVGHNLGLGFIPNHLEKWSVGLFDISSLTPGLLAEFAAKDPANENFDDYIIGIADPVDFLITNSSGQRLGHIDGQTFREIPNSYYGGDGIVEHFVIWNVQNETFQVQFKGLGTKMFSAIKSSVDGNVKEILVDKVMSLNEIIIKELNVSTSQIFSPLEIVSRIHSSIVSGPYHARMQAMNNMAQSIEKHVKKGQTQQAKNQGKSLVSEFNKFLTNNNPEKGLDKQEALRYLASYLSGIN